MSRVSLILSISLAVSMTACFADLGDLDDTHGDGVASRRLSGTELSQHLDQELEIIAPAPFARLGLSWDGADNNSFEISVRDTSGEWSRWHRPVLVHTEVEEGAAFEAEVDLGEDRPRAVKVRRVGNAQPSMLRVTFLELSAADDFEDGDSLDRGGPGGSLQAPAPLGIPITSRAAWGAKSQRCNSKTHSPNKITFHHTDTPLTDKVSVEARLRSIQSHHMNVRKWCDIGYHYLIAPDGRVFEGRPADRIGYHTGKNNTNNLGIAFIGTYNSAAPSDAQMLAAAQLMNALSRVYGVPLSRSTVKGHRQFKSTDCPGNIAYGVLEELIAMSKTDNGAPVINEPPPAYVTVKGYIYPSGETARVAGAVVSLTPGGHSTTTDSTGAFSFVGIPSGQYTINVRADGYIAATENRQFIEAESWSSVGLSRSGGGGGASPGTGDASLQGVVFYGGDGANRVGNAVIKIDGGGSVTASSAGYFTIHGLAPGTYTLRSSAPGYGSGVVVRTALNGSNTWASIELFEGASPAQPVSGGSCASMCGSTNAAPGSSPACYCDTTCEDYGDCCGDYAALCAAPAPTPTPSPTPTGPSCVGSCGTSLSVPGSSPACYCDASCLDYGDCCGDFENVCY